MVVGDGAAWDPLIGGEDGRTGGLPSRLKACLASPLTSLVNSQKQEAGRERCGEGEEHWWLPKPRRLVAAR